MAFFNNKSRSDSLVDEGMKYYNQKDFVRALEYFRQAAAMDNPVAFHNIAVCYANGQGVAYDPDEAYRWTEKAAEMGFANACYNAAIYNARGFGTDFHMGKAIRYINMAVEANPYEQAYRDYQNYLNSSDPKVLMANALVDRGFYFSQTGRHQEANQRYEEAAKLNQTQAMINLSVSYDMGYGVAVDRVKGFAWMKKAADLGNAYACFYAAKKYHEGDGCERNMDQAIFYSQRAADLDPNNADYRDQLIRYQNEKPKELSPDEMVEEANRLNQEGRSEEAFALTKKAADLGNVTAIYNMSVFYRVGAGTKEDQYKAFEYVKQAAEAGFVMAYPVIRDHYYFGRGVNRDLEEAIYWGKKAMEAYPDDPNHKTNLEAMRNEYRDEISGVKVQSSESTVEEELGAMVNESIRLNREGQLEGSFDLMKKAADRGFPLALFNMSVYYDIGAGVKEDKERSFEYLKKAAEAGYEPAYALLASRCYFGQGTDVDLKEAIYWQEKSIEASPDDQTMKNNLEVLKKEYEAQRNGVAATRQEKGEEKVRTNESDRRVNEAFQLLNQERYEEAYRIFKEEADKGNPYAMHNLSTMYMNGTFVEKNEETAFELMSMAAERGLAESCYQLARKYHFARGVIRDLDSARIWAKKAADLDPTIEEYRRFYDQVNNTEEREYGDALFWDGVQFYKEQNYFAAYRCFEKAAMHGHRDGMHNLSVMLYVGQGCAKDLKASLEWEEKAADAGNPQAYLGLFTRYKDGQGVDRDLSKAAAYIKKARDLAPEDTEICNAYVRFMSSIDDPDEEGVSKFLGSAYTYEESTQIFKAAQNLWINKKYKEALEKLIPIAKNGDRRALHYIGIAYYNGYDIEKNLSKADEFFEAAAVRGSFPARSYLSKRFGYARGASFFKLYNFVTGVEYDAKALTSINITESAEQLREGLFQYQKRERWKEVYEYNKVLSYGNPDVNCAKAENLLNMGKNDEAIRFFSRAAMVGHSYALYRLGYLFNNDPKLSEYCYRAASERGYKAAEYLY